MSSPQIASEENVEGVYVPLPFFLLSIFGGLA
jgi:hypothetical protein